MILQTTLQKFYFMSCCACSLALPLPLVEGGKRIFLAFLCLNNSKNKREHHAKAIFFCWSTKKPFPTSARSRTSATRKTFFSFCFCFFSRGGGGWRKAWKQQRAAGRGSGWWKKKSRKNVVEIKKENFIPSFTFKIIGALGIKREGKQKSYSSGTLHEVPLCSAPKPLAARVREE